MAAQKTALGSFNASVKMNVSGVGKIPVRGDFSAHSTKRAVEKGPGRDSDCWRWINIIYLCYFSNCANRLRSGWFVWNCM